MGSDASSSVALKPHPIDRLPVIERPETGPLRHDGRGQERAPVVASASGSRSPDAARRPELPSTLKRSVEPRCHVAVF